MFRKLIFTSLLVLITLLSCSCIVADAVEDNTPPREEVTTIGTTAQETEAVTEPVENKITNEEKKAYIASLRRRFLYPSDKKWSNSQLEALLPHYDMLKVIFEKAETGISDKELVELIGYPDYCSSEMPFRVFFWKLSPGLYLGVTAHDYFKGGSVFLSEAFVQGAIAPFDENNPDCQPWFD